MMKYAEITEKIIGCAMKVHSELKSGFQEYIYQRALEIELLKAGLKFIREYEMPVYYSGEKIGIRRVDFFVEDKIMVELKTVTELDDVHFAQALTILKLRVMRSDCLLTSEQILYNSKDFTIKK